MDETSFLVKHTKNVIGLYLQGERDLMQTVAELRDNVSLGLQSDIVLSLIDQAGHGLDDQRAQRLTSLLIAFSDPR